MLRLKNVCKRYSVADITVNALQEVSLNFRKSEFVSILGPSGSGKTTLLNIVGGLDGYTSGDLFIDGVSTKHFKSHDWDIYRNHEIGFVFQSYNLIPHQTILGNVELALTIAGIGKKERQERAKKALDKVGLQGLYLKKPNQLSGGQCQRVAIARALVNEPSILLADEPTGALDTVTSVQIMDLIQEISKEKLVIMVTHNPDLAEKYSTRIVRLLDGRIERDTNPLSEEEEIKEVEQAHAAIRKDGEKPTGKKNRKKKSKVQMSLWTAFKLSGKNLVSKLKRTVMIALAGCIGIVGISAVLSVSNGLQNYIDDMENDMLSGNPVYISSSAIDYDTLMGGGGGQTVRVNVENDKTAVFINSTIQRIYNMSGVMTTNTVTQEYMDYLAEMPEENCALIQYEYGYRIAPNLYTNFKTSDGKTHKMSIAAIQATYSSVMENIEDLSQYKSMVSTATVMTEMPSDAAYIADQYEVVYLQDGLTLEEALSDKSCLVAVVSKGNNTLNDIELAEYGYFSQEQFLNYCYKISGDDRYVDNDLLNVPEKMSYKTLSEKVFTWYPNDTVYTKGDADDDWGDKYYASAYADGTLSSEKGEGYADYKRDAFGTVDGMVNCNVKCVLKLKEDLSYGCLSSGGLYYTDALSEHIRSYNLHSEICQSAKESGSLYNIEMGYNFKVDGDSKQELDTYMLTSGGSSLASYISAFFGSSGSKKEVVNYSLSALGGEEFPSSISFYCVDFAQKDLLTAYLDVWNDTIAAESYKRDEESGFYIGKTTDENGIERASYYYYNEMTEKFYPVNLSEDGYAYDFRWNKYKLVYDEENGDAGFYQKLSDEKGEKFNIDGTVEISGTISVNAYSLASYILFGEEFQDSNPYYKDLESAGKGDNLFRYRNADGGYEYVLKVPNQSYYKVALDKEGNVLASQEGYGKYRYDESTDTFYKDSYKEEKVTVDEEEVTRYVLESEAVELGKVNLFADESTYAYVNAVKNPSYTIAGEKYILNTLGFYVDTTSIASLNLTDIKKRVKIDDTTTMITLGDYSGIDFYYKDETDTGFTYYYVDYREEDGVSYLYANGIASYLDSSSLGGLNVDGYIAEKYILHDDGTLQALSPVISDTSLTVGQLLELKVIGEPLDDCSILEADTSKKITYTDNIGLIIAMVNTLIEMITYALVAFTALSLFVSTVMIGIITYVSVVERTKEIGVIRSLGGRKRDVSNLFIAETFIIGLAAGLFGVGITYIISLILNAVIGSLTGIYTLSSFPVWEAAVMVCLSVALTSVSGVFPARSAAKKDPVVALRTE